MEELVLLLDLMGVLRQGTGPWVWCPTSNCWVPDAVFEDPPQEEATTPQEETTTPQEEAPVEETASQGRTGAGTEEPGQTDGGK